MLDYCLDFRKQFITLMHHESVVASGLSNQVFGIDGSLNVCGLTVFYTIILWNALK